MAQEREAENATPWWRSVPAILTAAATFIGSVAALLALFVGPGGGGADSNGESRATPPAASTPTGVSTVPAEVSARALGNDVEANVQTLLTMVPADVRSRCYYAPDAGTGDELTTLRCAIGGADFYYYLYPHELDALQAFRVSVSNEENYGLDGKATGHAPRCGAAAVKRPFVGRWTQRGESGPAGQQLCVHGSAGNTHIDWTETGRPVGGAMFYSGSVEDAELVWDRVVRG